MKVLIAVPSYGTVSTLWAQMFLSLQMPLGVVSAHHFDSREVDIAEKRNTALEVAIANGFDVLLFIGDDVFVPAETLHRLLMRWREGAKVVTGVYWSKSIQPEPYIFRGYMKGSFFDWKSGDYFPIDWSGCDCLLIDIKTVSKMKRPFFSREYTMSDDGKVVDMGDPKLMGQRDAENTEDLYFFAKLKEMGVQEMCDSSIQCLHEDRKTHRLHGLVDGMPQLRREPATITGKLIAEIGAGTTMCADYQENTIHRFDGDDSVIKPDYVCDVRSLPVDNDVYDIARASHVLEHLPFKDIVPTLREWLRILKVGGELIVNVPNLAFACKRILECEESSDKFTYDARWPFPYELLMVYGSQDGEYMFHQSGFTIGYLRTLAEKAIADQADIDVHYDNGGLDLQMKAIKKNALTIKQVAESFGAMQPVPELSPTPESSNGDATHVIATSQERSAV